jgi:hypothetical protein
MSSGDPQAAIRSELAAAHAAFHALLDSTSDEDWQRRSLNPGWTNGQILFHMTLGFMLLPNLIPLLRLFGRLPAGYSKAFAAALNAGTGLFNWINALGARGGGRFSNRHSLSQQFDRTHARILRLLDRLKPDEWQRGMYCPRRWDSMFDDYLTTEQVFRYILAHFEFHRGQLASGLGRPPGWAR